LIGHATLRNLCVRLTTNGYAVNAETLRRLADLNVFSVQISVDGHRETHDRFRCRQGAYDRAIRALRLFRDAGYTTLVTISATALNAREIPSLVEDLNGMGVNSVKIGPCAHLGRAVEHQHDLKLSPTQMRTLSREMQDLQGRIDGTMSLQLDGLFPFLFEPEPTETASGEQQCGPGCSAGISQVVVSCQGDVYPCPYIRNVAGGNLRDRSLGEIWHNEQYFAPLRTFDPCHLKGKCATCRYRPTHCTGGCRGAAYAAYGDLYAEDPNCWRVETPESSDVACTAASP
jgi:radical SAM protein with 4Fe4S-binding SPASM domain